jgi:hypothetical protein
MLLNGTATYAEDMSEEELEEIAETVLENYEADKDSRSEWEVYV